MHGGLLNSALSSAPLDVIIDTGVSSEQPPDSGWIEITVNTQGRHAVERIFPGWAFNWRPVQWPCKAWWSALLHVPSLAKRKVHFNRFDLGMASRLWEADDAELHAWWRKLRAIREFALLGFYICPTANRSFIFLNTTSIAERRRR